MDDLHQAEYLCELYPINPKGGEIMIKQAYLIMKDVLGDMDYVVCVIAAKYVPDMLQQCGEKKVKAVHLFTGRLSETGDEKAAESFLGS
jgi:acetyltransferase